MKKDKKTNVTPFWRQWMQSPDFLKSLFVYVTFSIIFIFVLILAWKQFTETPPREGVVLPSSSSLEKAPFLPNSHKLVALELMRGVLDGMIPLEILKRFLQKTPEPWANTLLTAFTPIKEGKTYSQLETLLILTPSQPVSTWQHIKSTIKSFIHIRKLDKKNEVNQGQLEDIEKALQAHDIQKATEIFGKLSPEEKVQLSSWKKLADERLLLELSTQKLLLELADS